MIDTHVHHWDLDRFRYPWLDDPDFDALRASYLPDDYRADIGSVPVQGWVHVQAEMDHGTDPVKEPNGSPRSPTKHSTRAIRARSRVWSTPTCAIRTWQGLLSGTAASG